MITIDIKITRPAGPKLASHQVEKFVEESLRQFQSDLRSFLETRANCPGFCDTAHGRVNIQKVTHAGIDVRESYSDGTFGLNGYNGKPIDCNPPQNRKNQTVKNNKHFVAQ